MGVGQGREGAGMGVGQEREGAGMGVGQEREWGRNRGGGREGGEGE